MAEKVQKSDQEWQAELTPEQYRVLREKATERAFTGKYHASKEPGTYRCAGCGTELFSSQTKYESGTGWPSFWEPARRAPCRSPHSGTSRVPWMHGTSL